MNLKHRYQYQLLWFTGCKSGGLFCPGPLHFKRAEILRIIGKHQQAEKGGRLCLDSAREAGHGKYLVKSLRFLAFIFQGRGDFKSAIETLEEARIIAKAGGYHRELMQIENYIGNVLNMTGDYSGAMEHYREHLALAEKLDDDEGRAASLGTMGLLFSHRQELDKAQEYIERSVAICRKVGDTRGEAANMGNLGVALAKQGKMDEAMECFKVQLALSKRQGSKGVEANALLSIALVHQGKGEVGKSLVQFTKLMDIYRSLGDRVGVSNVHGSMGDCQNSRNHFIQQKQLAAATGYRLGVYQAETGLAGVENYLKEYDLATEHANLVIEEALALKGKALLLDAYALLAKISHESGNHEKALETIDKVLEIDARHAELAELRKKIERGLPGKPL